MDSSLFGDVENNKNFTKNLNRTLEEAGKNAIQMWWAEIKTYGPIDQIQNIFYTHLGISSFAKVASDLTKGVGCSIVHCGSSINVVCHYATTLKNAVKLYNCGPYCKQCAGGLTSCVNGLCPATDGQCPASTAATIAAANTMCTNNIAMSDPLRTALLDKHNTLRSALATYTVPNGQTGKMLRRASKMPTLTYNCDLEKTAYEHALKCDQMGITSPDRLTENSHGFTITNKALTEAAKEAADSWWSEITALAAGIDQIQNLFYTHLGISSFAKMASDLTTQVGCGVAKCDSVINVVCHYNTTLANAVVLYKIGPSCNRCPQGQTGCINGLCPAE
ncbi:SCP-like protein [Oesophagostomum dentatum]|uniref:SCP-like protein n=1 Tax=Oesophagostomum dentatum TaxID=61180 RepID=A0A0B1TSR2_OESDE|nr:SCP-like protein [Oesophagostomum dentatum]